MLIYQGKSVCEGIAIGKIKIWRKNTNVIKKSHVENSADEYNRFLKARDESVSQLCQLRQKAEADASAESAEIFEIHTMLLSDEDFLGSIENFICKECLSAEYAVSRAEGIFSNMFSAMSDPYMQARASDIKDVSERLLDNLSGKTVLPFFEDDNVIIVAQELTPSETMQFDKSKIAAFVTENGSLNSHTAILSRMMNIPAILGAQLHTNNSVEGKTAIVDGYSGKVYVEPDEELLCRAKSRLIQDEKSKEKLLEFKGKTTVTADGKEIKLYANIGNIRDLPTVLDNDADGIGLFRSEFIFLERTTFPSEEEQFAIYKNAVETMKGKKVIIRTLDIGADKKVDYFSLPYEENPALGVRGIRLCLKRPDIFKTQLRALLRAAVHGDLCVMYPMISSLADIKRVKKIVEETAEDLSREGILFKIPPQGVMIETPASVIISETLAKEVSFFSIGTNDLTQYTMAMDRQNSALDEFADRSYEAVLKMIEITVKNAHKAGIWAGICGEAAADLSLTETFIKMGIDELSVSPASVLPLRERISHIRSDD